MTILTTEESEMFTMKKTNVWLKGMLAAVAATVAIAVTPTGAQGASIDILMLPTMPTVMLDHDIDVEIWFRSQGPGSQEWATADVLLSWGAGLTLTGSDFESGIGLAYGQLLPAGPPNNADTWSGAVPFGGDPVDASATGNGTRVATLHFHADAIGVQPISVPASIGLASSNILDNASNNILDNRGSNTVTVLAPEPAALALLGLGGLTLIGRRMRRR